MGRERTALQPRANGARSAVGQGREGSKAPRHRRGVTGGLRAPTSTAVGVARRCEGSTACRRGSGSATIRPKVKRLCNEKRQILRSVRNWAKESDSRPQSRTTPSRSASRTWSATAHNARTTCGPTCGQSRVPQIRSSMRGSTRRCCITARSLTTCASGFSGRARTCDRLATTIPDHRVRSGVTSEQTSAQRT